MIPVHKLHVGHVKFQDTDGSAPIWAVNSDITEHILNHTESVPSTQSDGHTIKLRRRSVDYRNLDGGVVAVVVMFVWTSDSFVNDVCLTLKLKYNRFCFAHLVVFGINWAV